MVGVVYTAKSTKNANDAVFNAKLETLFDKIDALEVKQDKHNSIIERTFLLEKNQAEQGRDIKTLYNHIDDVKGNIKDVNANVDSLKKTIDEVKECEIRLEGKVNK